MLQKIREKKGLLAGAFVAVAFSFSSGYLMSRLTKVPARAPAKQVHSAEGEESESPRTRAHSSKSFESLKRNPLVRLFADAVMSAHEKMQELKALDEENGSLRRENAELRLKYEQTQFACQIERSLFRTERLHAKLDRKTGSPVGRLPASINYIPADVHPLHLYTLGVSYLKAGEVDKAALVFDRVMADPEAKKLHNIESYLIAGVAWYRADNLLKANHYFDQVLKMPASGDSLKYQAQARLWKAMAYKRLDNQEKSQYWLKQLIDHHPRSLEAGWVNPKKESQANRAVAASHSSESGHSTEGRTGHEEK